MPLYEYECTTCHKHTEKIQKFSDPEITICPHCGGKLERVISAPAIAFKGGGWYADGYGNAKPKSAESSGSESKGGESKSNDSKNGDSGKSESTKSSSETSSSDSSSATPVAAPAAAPAASSSSSDKK
jgi:putative FmdB family regulatory protein